MKVEFSTLAGRLCLWVLWPHGSHTLRCPLKPQRRLLYQLPAPTVGGREGSFFLHLFPFKLCGFQHNLTLSAQPRCSFSAHTPHSAVSLKKHYSILNLPKPHPSPSSIITQFCPLFKEKWHSAGVSPWPEPEFNSAFVFQIWVICKFFNIQEMKRQEDRNKNRVGIIKKEKEKNNLNLNRDSTLRQVKVEKIRKSCVLAK